MPTSTLVHFAQILPLDGKLWRVAIDPGNVGRGEKWFEASRPGSRPATVPGVIQDQFPEYHGVAWYWRDFEAPANPHVGGRYLLRFKAVDYLAGVWINSEFVGEHEGAEGVFVLDATAAIKPGRTNRIAVRVLCPTYESIDGMSLADLPVGRRDYPLPFDHACHTGGIIDSVDLILAPAVRITELHVIPDYDTGISASASASAMRGPSRSGAMSRRPSPRRAAAMPRPRSGSSGNFRRAIPPSSCHCTSGIARWEMNDPYLYRVSARVQAEGGASVR